MSLLKLKYAPVLLIEDDSNKNILPLLFELLPDDKKVFLFSYEQPARAWEKIFTQDNVECREALNLKFLHSEYTSSKCTIIIASINEMALSMGWSDCFACLSLLSSHSNVEQLIIVLHKDCLTHSSKLQTHLNHMANATVSYNSADPCKVQYRIKKGTKVTKSEEILSYDTCTSTLRSVLVVKEQNTKDDELEKPCPGSLTTFKIEVDQIEKMEKSKLKLPYMSKIHEGESKVYYEPDAVDDWDEEDPDEDLNI